jgi:CRISPR-associated protein Cmr6
VNYRYLAPRRTAQLLQQHESSCLNLSLLLGRYVPYEVIEPTDRLNDRGRPIGKERNFWLQDAVSRFDAQGEPSLAQLVLAVRERWSQMTTNATRFQMEAQGRIIVGLGGKGALEFGLTLHPVTGLPYIPGSALKGLCRNYALLLIAEQLKIEPDSEPLQRLDEQIANHAEDLGIQQALTYRSIFGTQAEAGHCVFHDAVPTGVPTTGRLFVVEVMTPHFRRYYESQGGDAPHDGDEPNPVSYLSVAEGSRFGFAVGTRRGIPPNLDYRRQARDWLRAALNELGIGAKTAAGYGVFRAIEKA